MAGQEKLNTDAICHLTEVLTYNSGMAVTVTTLLFTG